MAARIGHHLLSELPFGRPPGKYLPLSIWLHLDTFLFGFEAAPLDGQFANPIQLRTLNLV